MTVLLDGIPVWLGVSAGQYALVASMVLVAGLVRGLTGFGLAILLVPLLNLVIPPGQAVLFAMMASFLVGALGVRGAWTTLERRTPAAIIALTSLAVMPFGLALLFRTPVDAARLLIAIIAIIAFVSVALPRPPQPPAGHPAAVLTGVIAGFLGGFAAMPGPPVIHYFARTGVAPAQARAAMIVVFFPGPVFVTLSTLATGHLDGELIRLALACAPALVIGNAIGNRNFGRVPERVWRGFVLLLVGGSAVGAALRLMG